ncbi:MAG: hypothetical protein ABI321_17675 [Polyangia bacterium]
MRALVLAGILSMAGCLGEGGAVNVRWRIAERETGRVDDPRYDSDAAGVCCQYFESNRLCTTLGWHITRVQLLFTDPTTGAALADPPAGLDAPCGNRELTTPFALPSGNFDILLRAYDPVTNATQAQSPLPEQRSIRRSEIVNLDIVELSVSIYPKP